MDLSLSGHVPRMLAISAANTLNWLADAACPGPMQSMIMAYCDTFRGLQTHNARSALKMTFGIPPTARTVKTRLNSTYTQASMINCSCMQAEPLCTAPACILGLSWDSSGALSFASMLCSSSESLRQQLPLITRLEICADVII